MEMRLNIHLVIWGICLEGFLVFSLAQNAVHMAIMYSSVAGGLV